MILWPFFPNWDSPYSETYAYLTEIIVSDAGREQRRAWRQVGRRSISYSALVGADRFRALRRTLAQQSADLIFPSERDRAYLASAAAENGTTADFGASPPAWVAAGQQVIFEDRQTRERVLRTTASVMDGVATFAAPSRAWASGTRVMPVMQGRMAQTMRLDLITGAVSSAQIDLDVTPGTENENPGLPASTFNGIEVLKHRPNWSRRPTIEVQDPTQWTDNQVGVRAPYVTVPFGTEILQSEHLIRNRAELDAVLGLFQRCRGRCGEFYVPSWSDDIALAEDTAAGSNQFVVAGHDFYDAYNGDRVRRAFSVRDGDDLHCFLISGMAKSTSGAPRTIVTTEAASPVTIFAAARPTVSWLLVCRFASDDLTVEWVTDQIANIVVNVQSTENLL